MKFHSPMILVSDINKSKMFYIDLLNEEVEQDLGSYIVFKGGFSMMSKSQWENLTKTSMIQNSSKEYSFELYFEEDDIDSFIQKLSKDKVEILTQLEEAPWGQRAIRILDLDNHVIEIAESMESVVRKFLEQGLEAEDVSSKTLMPIDFINKVKENL
ncbi:MAG: VOC family protein [Candidatus Cloacimonetes bacterium]|jgi:catechol 2,3-dioxygenase-like lactoylglutathione lyase family enzyme|nr:VOC family protein [Candidatus Paceibacterota bacterium]MDD4157001.1 VOC family protein [Candidatus Cloacimonadota bacterium]